MWSFILLTIAAGDDMKYVDHYLGLSYDWSGLQRPQDDPWKVMAEENPLLDSIYVFNFGTNLPTSCTPDLVSAIEVVELFDGKFASCSVIGRHKSSSVNLLDKLNPDKGLHITYQGGDRCTNQDSPFLNFPRRVTFKLHCNREETDWVLAPQDEIGSCVVIIEKYTRFGCPTYFTVGWNKYVKAIFWVVGSVLGYFIIGMIFNIIRGRSGPNVIPNVEMWKEAIRWVYNKFQHSSTLPQKLTGKGSAEKYEKI